MSNHFRFHSLSFQRQQNVTQIIYLWYESVIPSLYIAPMLHNISILAGDFRTYVPCCNYNSYPPTCIKSKTKVLIIVIFSMLQDEQLETECTNEQWFVTITVVSESFLSSLIFQTGESFFIIDNVLNIWIMFVQLAVHPLKRAKCYAYYGCDW